MILAGWLSADSAVATNVHRVGRVVWGRVLLTVRRARDRELEAIQSGVPKVPRIRAVRAAWWYSSMMPPSRSWSHDGEGSFLSELGRSRGEFLRYRGAER